MRQRCSRQPQVSRLQYVYTMNAQWFGLLRVAASKCLKPVYLGDRTAQSMIGSWHASYYNVVCLSVCDAVHCGTDTRSNIHAVVRRSILAIHRHSPACWTEASCRELLFLAVFCANSTFKKSDQKTAQRHSGLIFCDDTETNRGFLVFTARCTSA